MAGAFSGGRRGGPGGSQPSAACSALTAGGQSPLAGGSPSAAPGAPDLGRAQAAGRFATRASAGAIAEPQHFVAVLAGRGVDCAAAGPAARWPSFAAEGSTGGPAGQRGVDHGFQRSLPRGHGGVVPALYGARFVESLCPDGRTHVAAESDELVRPVLTRLFQRYGLPRAILVDNGGPFAGVGALGLSRLSVWWRRLGIAVHFTRPGKPQDNGAHEQMHRVLKAETLQPPARTLRGQQRRFERWRGDYNDERPHESLDGRVPTQFYHRSRRSWHVPAPLRYRRGWSCIRVGPDGRIGWQGRQVLIGRAFAGEWIGINRVRKRAVTRSRFTSRVTCLGSSIPSRPRRSGPPNTREEADAALAKFFRGRSEAETPAIFERLFRFAPKAFKNRPATLPPKPEV
jgi:hypothetical protein